MPDDLSNIPCVYGPNPMRPTYDGPWFPVDAPKQPEAPKLSPIDFGEPLSVATIDPELFALNTCYQQLKTLSRAEQLRILNYLCARLTAEHIDAQQPDGGEKR